MTKFKVQYYLGKDFYLSRLIESEDKETARNSALPAVGDIIEFENANGVLYRLDIKDVKLVTVAEYKPTSVKRKSR